jgi:hypothetical protein
MRRAAVVLLVALAAPSCVAPVAAPTPPSANAQDAAGPAVGEQRQHEAGSVTVSASWIPGTSSALVSLNTHSVDLDVFDLKDLARVRLDGGDWVGATAWDAPMGGHHRGGTLTFGTLDPQALARTRVIELEIRDVAVPSHLLRWERGP